MAAALRRVSAVIVSSSAIRSGDKSRAVSRWTARYQDGTRVRRSGTAIGLGLGLAAGGAAVMYFSYRGARKTTWQNAPVLPVLAEEPTQPNYFDSGDVHMSSHEHRFRLFSSVEYEGQLYMTPQNFIESVTMSEPRNKKQWRSLTKQELEKILTETPPVWKGSSKLFRNLQERGIIAYTEYLFLLCILTKPHAGFKIAFNMFDADGNQMVDKQEFLVLQEIFRKKNEKKGRKGDVEKSAQLSMQLYGYQVVPGNSVSKKESPEKCVARSYWEVLRRSASQALFSDLAEDFNLERMDDTTMIDTTLLVHFFGKKGKAELTFEDFYRFMDNIQTEMLEIEFLTYSKGMTTISEEDFARILLRYTNVEDIRSYLANVRHSIPDEKGITFEEFRSFFQFLNNLEDFAIAMQMYNFACRSIGQDEFARAVYVATGLTLTRHLVNTIFKIFDVDHDDQLSYKEFIGIMKDRLHRGGRVSGQPFFSCVRSETVRLAQ
ncbi:calcium uptake protein 3, mitochondrial isoform X2 [Trichomycterus rosablanca]|uniref:calcium uptake protein 3, mitochondrial isoform X2 n=1 Tax=Trichomycterus rosablanca TaxID=2290929 RepID=UPI002F35F6DF